MSHGPWAGDECRGLGCGGGGGCSALPLLLFGGQGNSEPLEARPGIHKPVDWGDAGPKIASVCAGRGRLQMLLGECFCLNGPAEVKPSSCFALQNHFNSV